VGKGAGAAGAEVTLSELDGVRYLHFGTEWVQGAMQLARPFELELEYQQQMMAPLLFVPKPADILQLGLGAAALTKFCHRHVRSGRIAAVELSPRVIDVARQWFALPADDERLRVVQAEAGRFLRDRNETAPAGTDWLQVDLYDARARGPVLDDARFYRDCRRALRAGGVAAFNLFGSSLQPSLGRIKLAFGSSWLRLPRSSAGNTVVLAFADDDAGWDTQLLQRRAQTMEKRYGLPMLDWLAGMRTASSRRLMNAPMAIAVDASTGS
jgi:spermidine synthase